MKTLFGFFIVVFLQFQTAIAQKQITLEVNDNGRLFRIWKSDKEHMVGEIVVIHFLIKNQSKEIFYIFEPSYLVEEPTIDIKKQEIAFFFGGEFSPHLNLVNRLKKLKIGEHVELQFQVDTKKLEINDEIEFYKVYVYAGFFSFADNLDYLTNSREEFIQVESESDISKLIDLHNEVFLGYLPVSVLKSSR